MLATSELSSMRRFSGAALVAALGCGVAFVAWASQPRAASSGPTPQQVAPVESAAPKIDTLQQGQALDESRALHPPRYPADALKEGKAGVTLLIVSIDARGGVTDIEVERSSGDARLDAAAREAAVKWLFKPAVKKGQPVASRVRVPVEFAMDGDHADPVKQARATPAGHAMDYTSIDWSGLDALLDSRGRPRVAPQEDAC